MPESYYPFCGCMNDEVVIDFRKMLKLMKQSKEVIYYTELAKQLKFSKKYILTLLTIAEKDNLTEHGTAIRGSWLTEEGKIYVKTYCRNIKGGSNEL